ncbi:hypothetical protein MNBD_ALPHA12-1400 [hydrothermal vent metagenome]|uniref:Uncharacterized protein n=1 Tax=hydrothermal vent metagenome TaxID=652676 RepID=A0A3B0UA06_9ZZZZ
MARVLCNNYHTLVNGAFNAAIVSHLYFQVHERQSSHACGGPLRKIFGCGPPKASTVQPVFFQGSHLSVFDLIYAALFIPHSRS